MKASELRRRLSRDRPMRDIRLRIPEDVVRDLERVAPHLGFSGHEPLIRAYISQGLRADLERLEGAMRISGFVESLRKQGVDDAVISEAMAEAECVVPEQLREDLPMPRPVRECEADPAQAPAWHLGHTG